jgi:hypothetical protein
MIGTVAEGKPGYEEVMQVIQEGFDAEAAAQAPSEPEQELQEVVFASDNDPAAEVKTEETLEEDNTSATENEVIDTDPIATIDEQVDHSSEPSWVSAKAVAEAERLAEKKSQELETLRQRYNLIQLF